MECKFFEHIENDTPPWVLIETYWNVNENFKKTWVYDEPEEVTEVRYNNINEVPEWGKATINKLIANGSFADANNLDLSEDMLRVFVILDRDGNL